MERDFMGLRIKVKHEEVVLEDTIDSAVGIGQSSKMQWTLTNKGSSGQQFLSFNSSKNDKPKTGFEALASAGLVSITTSDSSNNLQKQGGNQNHYAATTFPQNRFDSNPIHRVVTAPSSSLAMNYPAHNSFINSPAIPNLVGSASPHHVPISTRSVPAKNNNSSVVGTTELRNMSKNSDAPAQLTIFYAGSVCVYDDISPEKAQAIMLLAGNKPTITSNPPQVTVPMSPVQMPAIRPNPIVMNSFVEKNQNHVPTMSCFSSLVSVTSISSSQSGGGGGGGGSVTCDDAAAVRTTVTLQSPNSKTDVHYKNVTSIGFVPTPSTTILTPGTGVPQFRKAPLASPSILPPGTGVPQFRKASLARFLVKRKERVTSVSPYYEENKQEKEINKNQHHGSSSKSISLSSSGSSALPAGVI